MTQPMVQKKICMLGGFSVGKTSLVKRYVQSVFSEAYLTTVGVKIDKKTVDLPGKTVNLILWDLAGEDDIASLRMSYLRGSAGYASDDAGYTRNPHSVTLQTCLPRLMILACQWPVHIWRGWTAAR